VTLEPHDGDADNLVITGRVYSQGQTPPNGIPGEFWLVNAAGAFIKIQTGGAINVNAPGNWTLNAPTATITAPTEFKVTVGGTVFDMTPSGITATTETFTIDGNLVVSGTFIQGGGAATMQGPLTVINEVTGAGIVLGTHVHSGVTTGGGDTGAPVP
jgi:hypothetical protein